MNNDERFVTQPINKPNDVNTEPTVIKATIVSSSNMNTSGGQNTPIVNPNQVSQVNPNLVSQVNTQSVPVNPQVPVENTQIPTVNPQVPVNNTVTPQVTVNDQPQIDNKPGMIDENLKKVEINYTPPSKFKVFLLIFLFVLLIGFVVFLPDITAYIDKFKSGNLNYKEDKITTGRLKCSLETSTTNLDKKYNLTFKYTDSKLEKVEFTITTRGDATLDEDALNELNSTCNHLKESAAGLKGVYITCKYTDGELVETQNFELADVDHEKLNAAFIEAGGNNPEYQAGQDIDSIERNLNASGYTCKREK